MKLATLASDVRDGELVVVDNKFERAVRVKEIASTLQAALDNWSECEPLLQQKYDDLDSGTCVGDFELDANNLIAPLPRCYQFLDGSAYAHHMTVIRKARNDKIPDDFYEKPLLYQGMSHQILGPNEPLLLDDDEPYGVDFEAEIVVITDDVPMGVSKEQAGSHIKLLGLLNDFSLRTLIPPEIGRRFGFMQGKPANALAPFLVTPNELGDAWNNKLLGGRFLCKLNNKRIGELDPGIDATYDYIDLIVHATRTRSLVAGTVIGAGAIANEERSAGCGCLAELRAHEKIDTGEAITPFMKFGDIVRLEMFDKEGNNIFGTIEQSLERA